MNRPEYWKRHYQKNKKRKDEQAKEWARNHPSLSSAIKKRNYLKTYGAVISLKKKCVDCKRDYAPYQLDFDHVGKKTSHVASMIARKVSPIKVLDEVKRCEVVCANCHRARTHLRSQIELLQRIEAAFRRRRML